MAIEMNPHEQDVLLLALTFLQLARNNNREWFKVHSTPTNAMRAIRFGFDRPAGAAGEDQPASARRSAQDRRLVVPHLSRLRVSYNDAVQTLGRRTFVPRPSARNRIAIVHLHIAPNDCFAGGGIWHPEPAILKRIRDFRR